MANCLGAFASDKQPAVPGRAGTSGDSWYQSKMAFTAEPASLKQVSVLPPVSERSLPWLFSSPARLLPTLHASLASPKGSLVWTGVPGQDEPRATSPGPFWPLPSQKLFSTPRPAWQAILNSRGSHGNIQGKKLLALKGSLPLKGLLLWGKEKDEGVLDMFITLNYL